MRQNRNKYSVAEPKSLLNAVLEKQDIAQAGGKAKIEAQIYTGNKIIIENSEVSEVRYALRELYYNKCAYCEIIEYQPDIEHFRPKSRVEGEKGNKGYYWLAYEWTNLLPACARCNREKGKRSKFPINGTRVKEPSFDSVGNVISNECKASCKTLTDEVPGLLHPEIDIPELFFEIESNGRLKGIDKNYERGKSTIDICDLNRVNLAGCRKTIINSFIKRVSSIYAASEKFDLPINFLTEEISGYLQDLLSSSKPDKQYSFVRLYILENFLDFINENLKSLGELELQHLIYLFDELTLRSNNKQSTHK